MGISGKFYTTEVDLVDSLPVPLRHPSEEHAALLQVLLKLLHVVVGVAHAPRLGQPDAVDDRGVVEAVRDDGVVLAAHDEADTDPDEGNGHDRPSEAHPEGKAVVEDFADGLISEERAREIYGVAVRLVDEASGECTHDAGETERLRAGLMARYVSSFLIIASLAFSMWAVVSVVFFACVA